MLEREDGETERRKPGDENRCKERSEKGGMERERG